MGRHILATALVFLAFEVDWLAEHVVMHHGPSLLSYGLLDLLMVLVLALIYRLCTRHHGH